ncbi:enoyl-CoA hydratase/isomerase family protein [uncultured Sphingomonas sp.]|uniref:enoyl-CoA hydratase/isomerase family protein n=1 Tax=uncultured Sphingomonas sp. TaxID=158754 RepID=UPI0035CB10DC
MSAVVIADRPAPGVLRLRINRPEKRNAVDFAVRDAMIEVLEAASGNTDTRALLIGGVGGHLSAGGDVPSMGGLDAAAARARLDHIHRLCRLVVTAPWPIVTAAEGAAAGAVVGLALLGDWVVAGPGTRFLLPFFRLGLIPDWGLMHTLPQRIGLAAARRLVLGGGELRGEEAARIGLADTLVPDDEVADAALARAVELARLPRGAVAAAKMRWREPAPTLDEALRREADDQVALLTGDDFRAGHAAFKAKRAPVFD